MEPLEKASLIIKKVQDRDKLLKDIRERGLKDIRVLNYETVKPHLVKHWETVLEVLKNDPTPMTSEEVAEKCYLDKYQVRRAMSELKKRSKVKEFSQNKIDGFWRTLWVIV